MKFLILLATLVEALSEAKPSKVPSAYEDPLTEAPIKSITIVADEWCPYTCNPKKNDNPGYMTEIAQEIYGNQDIQVVYKMMPWERALSETKKGNYNAVLGINKPEGDGLILPKSIFGVSIFHFYVREDSQWRYTNTKSLSAATLGLVESYNYGAISEYAERYKNEEMRVQFISSDGAMEKNFKKLMSDRITALYEDKYVVDYFIKKSAVAGKLRDAGHNKLDPDSDYVYIGFHDDKTGKRLAKMFDTGLEKMRQTGRLTEILNKYGITDWEETK